ncbi:hypothetical protein IJD34_02425 [bacterium]|nr:hypothetical protein [bacterium]
MSIDAINGNNDSQNKKSWDLYNDFVQKLYAPKTEEANNENAAMHMAFKPNSIFTC